MWCGVYFIWICTCGVLVWARLDEEVVEARLRAFQWEEYVLNRVIIRCNDRKGEYVKCAHIMLLMDG